MRNEYRREIYRQPHEQIQALLHDKGVDKAPAGHHKTEDQPGQGNERQDAPDDRMLLAFFRALLLKAIPHNSKCADAMTCFASRQFLSSDDTKIRRQGTAPVKDFCEV